MVYSKLSAMLKLDLDLIILAMMHVTGDAFRSGDATAPKDLCNL